MARERAPDTRDRILRTAARLFLEQGVRAVGMQQIIDESGTGKNVLYREFPSKDDLVVACLSQFRSDWAGLISEHVDTMSGDPAGQLVALARLAAAQVSEDGHRGCVFRNCYNEFPDADHPVRRAAGQHLQSVRRQVLRLAKLTDPPDPVALGERIWLVIEGIYAAGVHPGGKRAASTGVAMVAELVADHAR